MSAGLRNTLTGDRLTRKNNQIYYMCTCGGSIKIWAPRTNQAVEIHMGFELRRKGGNG